MFTSFKLVAFMVPDDGVIHKALSASVARVRQVCSGEEHSGFPADVWALGVTIFLLATGRPPFVARYIAQ
jgi:serine/threonine protein kinase